MNYIILKKDARKEFRLYVEGNESEGQVLYKGHKLSLEVNQLGKILDYRMEKSSNKLHFLIYDKIKESVTIADTSIWRVSSSESFDRQILESWESAQRALESKCGKFRKILITMVNI
jgi:hypothetical protein